MGVFHKITTSISQDQIYLFLLAFWLSLATSLIVSREIGIGFYGLVRFTETLLLFAYVRENVSYETFKPIFWLILAFSVFESLLGIGQYLTQSSFDLYFLGEPYLRAGLKGAAEFVSSGVTNPILANLSPILHSISRETINIRAYGTLPHPNVLAVFLFTGFLCNIWLLYVSQKHKSPSPHPSHQGRGIAENSAPLVGEVRWGAISRGILLFLSLILISTGLVVTFSRTAWAAALLSLIVLGLVLWRLRRTQFHKMQSGQGRGESQSYFPKRIALISMVLLVALGLNWFLFGQQIRDRLFEKDENIISNETFVNRWEFNSIALKMIKAYPVFGVGLRNFVARMDEFNTGERLLPYMHQPSHNIYLLLAAETGLVGLAAFLILLFGIARVEGDKGGGEKIILLVMFGGFLFLGLFDHYFVSIHQSATLFWLVAGLLSARQ